MQDRSVLDVRPMPCLLVVDDDPVILGVLTSFLEAHYQVVSVRSGEAALEVVDGGLVIDGALVDVVMDGMDGFELAVALRERPATAAVPIVMLTALDDAEHRERAHVAGADAYLTKPFEPALLEATIAMHVPRGSLFP